LDTKTLRKKVFFQRIMFYGHRTVDFSKSYVKGIFA